AIGEKVRAIRTIVGIGEDVAGSLFLFDGARLDWRKIRLPKDPNCRTCVLRDGPSALLSPSSA
ncbi:MAG: hypothetical protein ACJ8E3_04185, partial [Sphingomicrobium sp.]